MGVRSWEKFKLEAMGWGRGPGRRKLVEHNKE